jgi:magnesium transporter
MNIKTVTFNKLSFVNVTNPQDLEIRDLKKNFGFHALDLEDYVNRTQIPDIKIYKNYSLIVLDFPFFKQNGSSNGTNGSSEKEKADRLSIATLLNIPHAALSSIPLFHYTSVETRRILTSHVNIFIGKDYVVALHEGVLAPIDHIFSLCQRKLSNRDQYMGQDSIFLAYKIIDALVDNYFPVVNELIIMIEKIDRELENKKTQTPLDEISVTRRNIVFFQTMIKPVVPLFDELEQGKHETLSKNMTFYWSNVNDHLKKIAHRLEDSRELVEGISESNESLIASKTNEIIKVLTIFSAVILPLNLVAGIYGMNIGLRGLPLAEDPLAFELIALVMIGMGIIMLLFFKARRWF